MVRRPTPVDRSGLDVKGSAQVFAVEATTRAQRPLASKTGWSISLLCRKRARRFRSQRAGLVADSKGAMGCRRVRIHAASVEADTVGRLGVALGSACLIVERRTWNRDGLITNVRFSYPGDRIRWWHRSRRNRSSG